MMRSLWIACVGLLLLAVGILPAQVMINEVLYDTPGGDDTAIMFTELYGPAGTDLSGYTLVGVNGNGGTDYLTVTLSGTIPQDGYFVVGGSAVNNVDQVEAFDLQNAGYQSSNDCDCLELRSQGVPVDKVRYGECEAGHDCEGEGGTNAPDYDPPSSGPTLSIARIPDHQDTDDNAADWAIPDELTPGEPNTGSDTCNVHYYTISQVQEDNADGTPMHAGEFVHIIGIATIANYVLDTVTTSFYIQDDEAGVNIFGSIGTPDVARGDCVIVEGWISHYNGLCEITTSGAGNCTWDLEVVTTGDMPDPLLVTCNTISTLGEDYEGMLVKIEGVTIQGGDPWPTEGNDANVTIGDGTGTCVMRIDKDTDIAGQPQPDEPFDVVGIANQYDFSSPYTDGYQILPRDYADLTTSGADDPVVSVPERFKLLGCFPNPFNATTRISFAVGRRMDVSVYIYDLLGREVMKASVPTPSPGEYSYTWNGASLSGSPVSTGLYLVRIKAGAESAFAKLLLLK
jgi:hypothetical protein